MGKRGGIEEGREGGRVESWAVGRSGREGRRKGEKEGTYLAWCDRLDQNVVVLMPLRER